MDSKLLGLTLAAVTAIAAAPAPAVADAEQDRQIVAALDLEFQAATKRNDAEAIDQILHDDFVLVLGDGRVVSREMLMAGARAKSIIYEQQDEDPGTQTVRVWGDTAVVTARLWVKGVGEKGAIDRRLWFSDTYVRTPKGWRYAFAQASLPLPN
ncbi:nuclear transport factor 2 family protein [Phenylobacterium sp.]|uniref:nuclear transport factor 2 family protein n=1 Tax=Phenylobacterium sp. TaxID=1871053 RepID=UPI00286CD658|nr:nuclear transport factor 2 family protein [Phenylobacterium sp.]